MPTPEGSWEALDEACAVLELAASNVAAEIAEERHRVRIGHVPLTHGQAREFVRPYQGPPEWGGPIARFVATGEIVPSLLDELNHAQDGRAIESDDAGWERLNAVIRYVRTAGTRPPLSEWAARP
ncbi:hypothetical protein ACIQWV_18935 [Streptomyces sp. NPDC098085]|uniref:hypothetical protein n=1 Tax=unclassified Streptomyces TaxID=2593676 RepID=UPI0037FAA244